MLKNKTTLTFTISIILSLLLLTACATQSQEFTFEMLKRTEYSYYKDSRPGLMVITNIEETKSLGKWLYPDAQKLASQVDYTRYFVVVAFRGRYRSAHDGIKIEAIKQQGDSISVVAWMGNPRGDTVLTSHYHMVKVERIGDLATIDTYTLIVNGEAEAIIEQASSRNTPIPPSLNTSPFTSPVPSPLALPLMSSPLKPLPPTSTRPPTRTAYPTKEPPSQTQSSSKKGRWRFDNGTWKFDIVEE